MLFNGWSLSPEIRDVKIGFSLRAQNVYLLKKHRHLWSIRTTLLVLAYALKVSCFLILLIYSAADKARELESVVK